MITTADSRAMQDKLVNFLNDLRRRKDIRGYSEADTKQSIILRLLSLIGWDPYDPEEVKAEYTVGDRRVDFALRRLSVPKVFIEVKKVDEPLTAHEEQLITYATTESVKLAILTNGITWWLYLPLVEGKWDQKKFYTIDIYEQDPDQAAEKFIRFLSKSMTESGAAIKEAEIIVEDNKKIGVISRSLPIAWNRLVDSADDLLVVLLKETTEKLCGYEIDIKTVIEFFEQHQSDLTIPANATVARSHTITTRKPAPKIEADISDIHRQRSKDTTLRVIIDWQRVGKSQPSEIFENERGVTIFLRVLERIAGHVGMTKFAELLNFQVYRGMLLSKDRTKYHRKELLGYYVLTYNATDEKAKILKDVAAKFGLPADFLTVDVAD